MTPQSNKDFMTWLAEEIENATACCKENDKHPHTYGAGYDSGYLSGLLCVQQYFTGEE